MHQRDKLHSLAIQLNSPTLMKEYRVIRNMVTLQLRQARKYYIDSSISNNMGNHSKMWKTLKKAMGCSTKCVVSDKLNAEQFNTFFANVGSKLSENFGQELPNCPPTTSVYTFTFAPIQADEVYKALCELELKPKLDILLFDSYLLRLSAHLIAETLAAIFNVSCKGGHVPNDFKWHVSHLYTRRQVP
jgi:hypothetical protein